MFSGEMQSLKEEFKDHFRNISRIMDCVGCEKCRLWGKIQVSGIGTALKILFSYESELDGHPIELRRSEVISLYNAFGRISESIADVHRFRALQKQKYRFHDKLQGTPKWIFTRLIGFLPDSLSTRLLHASSSISKYSAQILPFKQGIDTALFWGFTMVSLLALWLSRAMVMRIVAKPVKPTKTKRA